MSQYKTEKDQKEYIFDDRLQKLEEFQKKQAEIIAKDIKAQMELVTEQVNQKYTQLWQHEAQGKVIDNQGMNFAREMQQVKSWINLMNQVMELSSVLDVQDEIDRSTLSLIGQKPIKLERSGVETSPRGETTNKYKSPNPHYMCDLDPVCMTCSNTTTAEKRILYDQFKLACLKYKPSDIEVKDGKGEFLKI